MENKPSVLVHNSVTCLQCNRVLISYTQHDYKTCGCPNETMVDGGTLYSRIGGKDMKKVKSFFVHNTDDFQLVRRFAKRGGRGLNGDEPLSWIAICDMNDDWLEAVLVYPNVPEWQLELIKKEIDYRLNIKVNL